VLTRLFHVLLLCFSSATLCGNQSVWLVCQQDPTLRYKISLDSFQELLPALRQGFQLSEPVFDEENPLQPDQDIELALSPLEFNTVCFCFSHLHLIARANEQERDDSRAVLIQFLDAISGDTVWQHIDDFLADCERGGLTLHVRQPVVVRCLYAIGTWFRSGLVCTKENVSEKAVMAIIVVLVTVVVGVLVKNPGATVASFFGSIIVAYWMVKCVTTGNWCKKMEPKDAFE